eukprot:scaffold13864_cov18-Tisochrysis_lutea.AAC.1
MKKHMMFPLLIFKKLPQLLEALVPFPHSKFITDHGGHTNAYTSAENTNYQFDINWWVCVYAWSTLSLVLTLVSHIHMPFIRST